MNFKCPECRCELNNLEDGFYGCENCDSVWYPVASNTWQWVEDLSGYVTAGFKGDVQDIMITGESEKSD